MPVLYTVDEVAKLLKVNKNYVYDLISNGYIKSMKLGRRKITKTSLDEFLIKYDGYDFSDIKNPVLTM